MTATELRTRPLATTELPRGVRTATNILYILIFLGLVTPMAFLAVTIIPMVRENTLDTELTPALMMAAGAVAVGVFFLLLIRKTRKGRRWAWMSLLMMLSLMAFVGFLVMTAVALWLSMYVDCAGELRSCTCITVVCDVGGRVRDGIWCRRTVALPNATAT